MLVLDLALSERLDDFFFVVGALEAFKDRVVPGNVLKACDKDEEPFLVCNSVSGEWGAAVAVLRVGQRGFGVVGAREAVFFPVHGSEIDLLVELVVG